MQSYLKNMQWFDQTSNRGVPMFKQSHFTWLKDALSQCPSWRWLILEFWIFLATFQGETSMSENLEYPFLWIEYRTWFLISG